MFAVLIENESVNISLVTLNAMEMEKANLDMPQIWQYSITIIIIVRRRRQAKLVWTFTGLWVLISFFFMVFLSSASCLAFFPGSDSAFEKCVSVFN